MNKWDQRYSTESFAYGTEPNDFLAEHAYRIPTGSCLCLADGEGRNGVYLASLGHKVTSVDSSKIGLEKARKLADQKGVEIETIQSDLADFTFEPEAYNGIVSIFCHLPPELRKDVHRKSVAALRPGGAFLLEGYTPRQLDKGTGGPPSADLLPTIDELRHDLEGLDFLIAREAERAIHEGSLHTGIGSVAQVLAFKR